MKKRRRSIPTRVLSVALSRPAIALLAFVAVLAVAGNAFACPTCADGIAGADATSKAMAQGYFYSILFMMSMPFLLVGTFGGAAYFSIRRAGELQRESQAHAKNENNIEKKNPDSGEQP